MNETNQPAGVSWLVQACTLPTTEQPLRLVEFDQLFATDVRTADRLAADRLRLELTADPAVAARAADLAVRETACCSFFVFTLTASDGRVTLDVTVPESHVNVLDALAARATTSPTPPPPALPAGPTTSPASGVGR